MFALVAAIIFALLGLGVIHDTEDVQWFMIGLSALALHFAIGWGLPIRSPWDRAT